MPEHASAARSTSPAWRIATEARTYAADDLGGTGAQLTGGRWNAIGTAVIYASPSLALAVLETFVHLASGGLPLNRFVVRLDIPDALMAGATVLDTPPVGWDAEPAGGTSIALGERWIKSGISAILRVPSIIVPEELNVLINPAHPDAAKIKAQKIRRYVYDARMR